MEERRRNARNPRRGIDVMWETGKTWSEQEKNIPGRQERIGSVDVNPGHLEISIRKEAGREAQGAQG